MWLARGLSHEPGADRHRAAGEGDQRLDRWFRRRFPHVPQGRIEKMCRKGEIRVDGGRVKPATRLDEGQEVRIPPLPDDGRAAALRAARNRVGGRCEDDPRGGDSTATITSSR